MSILQTTQKLCLPFFETDFGKYPRLQISTIEELLAKQMPQLPLVDPTAFKKAPVEINQIQSEMNI